MSAEKAVVIGASGLIGRTMVHELAKKYEVIAVNRGGSSDKNLKQIQGDVTQNETLKKVVGLNASIIVNCVNIATIFSLDKEKGYDKVVKFYLDLYDALLTHPGPLHYVQIGTTGSGGLGLNIPFSHGEDLKSLPIINKAAFAGIGTSLLTLMSRSFPRKKIKVSEFKPGLAIFDPTIKKSEWGGSELVTIDGGESGDYTYQELALLTSYMGFTTAEQIVQKIMSLVERQNRTQNVSSYDVTEGLNQLIIGEDAADRVSKETVLTQLRPRDSTRQIIATGSLGPPVITRDLLLATLLTSDVGTDGNTNQVLSSPALHDTLNYLQTSKPELYRTVVETTTADTLSELSRYREGSKDAWQIVKNKLDHLAAR